MRPNLISFDLRAGFGVFKKPDVNEGLQLTFNLLHKPALLGILGAIAGLEGYQRRGVFPDYYTKLGDLRVGVEPLDHDKGNFTKTVIKYTNTVGYANADGNLIITEQTLRCPAYRCYLMLDLDDEVQALLHDRIRTGEADYLPYFGKNECSAWWDVDAVKAYEFEPFQADADFRVDSLFVRKGSVREEKADLDFDIDLGKMVNAATYIYFERLPIDFFVGDLPEAENPDLFSDAGAEPRKAKPLKFVQYELAEFVFTDCTFRKGSKMPLFLQIKSPGEQSKIIQLF
ncbi:MAG: type I-B CRISPR-associated protein Cas5b [Saprospiraceae bacterium]